MWWIRRIRVRLRVSGLELLVSGLWFRISGFGFGDWVFEALTLWRFQFLQAIKDLGFTHLRSVGFRVQG